MRGFVVCVLSGSRKHRLSIHDIKTLILEKGGQIVENPLPNNDNCILVAGDDNYRVQIFARSTKYNIARLDWLLDYCHEKRDDLRPSDLLTITSGLRSNFKEYYEQVNDED